MKKILIIVILLFPFIVNASYYPTVDFEYDDLNYSAYHTVYDRETFVELVAYVTIPDLSTASNYYLDLKINWSNGIEIVAHKAIFVDDESDAKNYWIKSNPTSNNYDIKLINYPDSTIWNRVMKISFIAKIIEGYDYENIIHHGHKLGIHSIYEGPGGEYQTYSTGGMPILFYTYPVMEYNTNKTDLKKDETVSHEIKLKANDKDLITSLIQFKTALPQGLLMDFNSIEVIGVNNPDIVHDNNDFKINNLTLSSNEIIIRFNTMVIDENDTTSSMHLVSYQNEKYYDQEKTINLNRKDAVADEIVEDDFSNPKTGFGIPGIFIGIGIALLATIFFIYKRKSFLHNVS